MREHIYWPLLLAALTVLPTGMAAAESPGIQRIELKGDAGGKRFDGIGVVDGGGATSVLLKDYPEPQRSQILDLMYKPKFGASVSALLVEIPGDGNSTQGSMPSHMHTRNDLDYTRGYTWWVMQEAKKRNPALTLDGTAWSGPGWLGDNGQRFTNERDFFSPDGADYYVSWLKGLRTVYGLELDAIGSRNEKGVSYDFVKALRARLNANGYGNVKIHSFDNWMDQSKYDFVKDMPGDKELRDSIDIISAHVNVLDKSKVPPAVREAAANMGKPLWNTEGHVYIAGYDGAIGVVRAFNENYIHNGITKIVNWYGIAGVYTTEPYNGEKESAIRANWPWSGHYRVNPHVWAYAHYGQFTEVGWTYLNEASGDLAGGGSYVTLMSPRKDFSVIIETREAKAPQQLRIEVGGGLSTQDLSVWRSNEKEQFVRLADLRPQQGAVTLALDPNSIYSLTTTRGQQKGEFPDVPALKAFPFPYRETFEQYARPREWGHLPRYFADIAGAFELTSCPGGKGKCMRQAVPVPTHSWAPEWKPYTIIGDDQWSDYEISADIYLNPGDTAGVMGRINHVGTGFGVVPKGYFLQLSEGGQIALLVSRGPADKKALVGDAEQQALIKARNDASEGGEKVLAAAQVPGVGAKRWHNLKLQFKGASITGYVDGKPVLTAADGLYGKGMAGLMSGADAQKLGMPYFDNVTVNQVNGSLPAPAAALPGQGPMYRRSKQFATQ
ncbi:MAG: galactosylceramidase [Pseudomonadota bacterium]